MSTNGNAHLPERFPVPNPIVPVQQQAQSSPALLNQSHWPPMLPHNQNQHFNSVPTTTSWQQSHPVQQHTVSSQMPQIQPQGYPMPPQLHQTQTSLPFDISSIVPQQIMQDFMRLSTPVGSSQNDDTILAQALSESRQNGKTYRQALEGLHGVNNHAANLWKDYYLDHHDRFDILVSRLNEQPKTVKKPFASSMTPPHGKEEAASQQVARKRRVSPSPMRQAPKPRGRPSTSSQAAQRRRAAPTTHAVTNISSVLGRPPKRPRATLNSLSAPLPSYENPNLMPPQVHISLPDPPSRSPTPPTLIQPGTNGNKYTKEDREYFVNFITWRLNQNPSLTKRELSDKILATYRGDYDSVGDAEEDEESNDEDEDDAESEAETPRTRRDLGDPNIDTEEDEADMGEPGSAFTRGDWCILARFIAKNHWDEMTPKERWNAFTDTYETRRTDKAWAEFYRKNEDAILRLSKRYSPGKRFRAQRGSDMSGSDEDGDYETDNGDS
ncbi:hypothetical protein BU15DRAFT_71533 [Melanogaster broomeanus]|nr:hypothetical protein BU15DRAFT_71533 [Melanogaster broomeanus]